MQLLDMMEWCKGCSERDVLDVAQGINDPFNARYKGFCSQSAPGAHHLYKERLMLRVDCWRGKAKHGGQACGRWDVSSQQAS